MIWELIISHPYISVFIGLVVGGESVLLPALYLATQKILSIKYVWCIAILAVAISDSFWYYVGYKFSPQCLSKIPFFKKNIDTVDVISRLFKRHGLILIFTSKFVYGTRVATQVFSGSIRVPFLKYFFVNMAGVISFNLVFTVLAYSVSTGLSRMKDYVYAFEVGFLIFIIFIILINIFIKYCISNKLFS